MNTKQKAERWLMVDRYRPVSAVGEIITALLAEREAFESRIAELEKPYVPMTDDEQDAITKMQWGNGGSINIPFAAHRAAHRCVEAETIKRYNEQRGVK